MSPTFDVKEQDRRLAREINQDARTNPSSPYLGKFVAIADGQVVAVGERLDEVVAAFRKVVPDRNQGLVIEASADYDGPHEIWSSDRCRA
jgi:Family of unknown function (DUF5678)